MFIKKAVTIDNSYRFLHNYNRFLPNNEPINATAATEAFYYPYQEIELSLIIEVRIHLI